MTGVQVMEGRRERGEKEKSREEDRSTRG